LKVRNFIPQKKDFVLNEHSFTFAILMVNEQITIEQISKDKKIKRAVLKTVGEIGVAGLTMKKIATEAEISPGTLYLYFASKDQMINKLYLDLKKELAIAAFNGFTEEATIPFPIAFKAIFTNLYQYLANHPAEQVFLQQGYKSPFITDNTRKEAEVYYQPMIEMVNQAQSNGVITSNIPAQMILAFTNGVLQEAAQACLVLPTDQQSIVGDGAFEFCWNAIKLT
jgi:AcrR family transcriptional regulator